jgi:uridylate kinase
MAPYTRILLKLSGEALSGDRGVGFDAKAIDTFCRQIVEVHDTGVQIALVVGGGNIFRGLAGAAKGMDRVTADHMGMLATVINGLALRETLVHMGLTARVVSALTIGEMTEPFNHAKAIGYLSGGQVVIFVGGTGNPFFSTDSAASLRAAQIGADVVLKGTKVDGVYDGDPVHDSNAVKFDTISFDEVLSRGLQIMDATAITMCRENSIPIIVFNMLTEGTLLRVVNGEPVGTAVKEDQHG